MKLYLTASSERGKEVTKGGQEFLAIVVQNDRKEVIAKINFYPDGDARFRLHDSLEYDLERVVKV